MANHDNPIQPSSNCTENNFLTSLSKFILEDCAPNPKSIISSTFWSTVGRTILDGTDIGRLLESCIPFQGIGHDTFKMISSSGGAVTSRPRGNNGKYVDDWYIAFRPIIKGSLKISAGFMALRNHGPGFLSATSSIQKKIASPYLDVAILTGACFSQFLESISQKKQDEEPIDSYPIIYDGTSSGLANFVGGTIAMKVLDYEFIHYNNLDFSVVSFCKKVISIEIANNIAPFAGARFAKVPGYFLTGAVISSTIVTSARIVLNTQTKLFENEIISSDEITTNALAVSIPLALLSIGAPFNVVLLGPTSFFLCNSGIIAITKTPSYLYGSYEENTATTSNYLQDILFGGITLSALLLMHNRNTAGIDDYKSTTKIAMGTAALTVGTHLIKYTIKTLWEKSFSNYDKTYEVNDETNELSQISNPSQCFPQKNDESYYETVKYYYEILPLEKIIINAGVISTSLFLGKPLQILSVAKSLPYFSSLLSEESTDFNMPSDYTQDVLFGGFILSALTIAHGRHKIGDSAIIIQILAGLAGTLILTVGTNIMKETYNVVSFETIKLLEAGVSAVSEAYDMILGRDETDTLSQILDPSNAFHQKTVTAQHVNAAVNIFRNTNKLACNTELQCCNYKQHGQGKLSGTLKYASDFHHDIET
jgi:hypothetical protein